LILYFFIRFDADLCVSWMQHSKIWPSAATTRPISGNCFVLRR